MLTPHSRQKHWFIAVSIRHK